MVEKAHAIDAIARKKLLAAVERMYKCANERDVYCPPGEFLAPRQVGRLRFHLLTYRSRMEEVDFARRSEFFPMDDLYPTLQREFVRGRDNDTVEVETANDLILYDDDFAAHGNNTNGNNYIALIYSYM